MILVFFQLPLTGIQSPSFNMLNGRAASAAAEIAAEVEWLVVYP